MNTFGRNLIPFANTGAVCRIHPVDKNDRLYSDLGSSKEFISDIIKSSINFVIFAGFGNPKDLSILRKELEDKGVKFVNYSFTALPSSAKGDGQDEYSNYALILEKFKSAMKSKNFLLCFPSGQFMNAVGLLWGSMVLADETLDEEEFDQYLFADDFTGRKSLKEDLSHLKQFLYSQERLLQKSLRGIKKLLEDSAAEDIFQNPLNLNLSSLEKPVHISPVDTTEITFNLESLEPMEFVSESDESEQAEKIVDELLNMAEQLSLDSSEEELTWESAFPDTGQKISSNLTIIKDLDTEPLTEIDLDSVPYPEVLDIENLDLEELDDPVTVPISEISFEDDDDRTIMGIVTVETEPEETVRKTPKKETPPPTIIVTAEKVETIKPISEEFKNKSKNNFRAIHLD